ncbi:helix-turn-helix domain-containing protein [Rhodococcus oryzae]|uniref:helix-turn-helix domain-containing protein n=1 Tax=Rhodococcus oryzae TaxID=2571143 RepID=UPI003714D054
MGEVQRLDGVFLSPDDARTLADALAYCEDALIKTGRQWTPRMQRLRSALAAACVSRTDGGARKLADRPRLAPLLGHEFVDTATAAEVLGCTPANVRYLVRRGTLPGRRVGGRWLVSADAIHARTA